MSIPVPRDAGASAAFDEHVTRDVLDHGASSALSEQHTEQCHTPYARQFANLAPAGALIVGGLLGVVIATLYAPVAGRALAAVGAVSAVALVAARRAMLRSARVASAAGVYMVTFVALSFAALSASAAGRLFGPATGLVVFGATGLVLAAASKHYAARREVEWETQRLHNTTRALDLGVGTYAFGADRGFRYKPDVDTDTPETPVAPASAWRWVGAAGALAAGLPVVLGRPGGIDPRTYVVLVLGAPPSVCFAPVIATVLTNYRKLAAYERELGREITNA